jgi:hypothetical protein
MSTRLFRRTILGLILGATVGAIPAFAQLSQNMQDWMRRLASGEFSGAPGGRGGRGGYRAGPSRSGIRPKIRIAYSQRLASWE